MGNLVRAFGDFPGPSASAASVRGPYWQPVAFTRGSGQKFNQLGAMGDTNLVLPTQTMSGASGYITAVVTAPPAGQITWNSTQTPAVEVWVKDSTGAIKLFSGGNAAAGSGSVNWLTAGSSGVTFYVIPVDANGVHYAPVDQVTVPGQAGIYPSPNTPNSVINQLAAANQGTQVYGVHTNTPITMAPAGFFDFLDTLPGGKVPWLVGGAAAAALLVVKK